MSRSKMDEWTRAFYREFGREIREHRLRLGLNQADFGAKLEPALGRTSIAHIERGNQYVTAHHARQMARLFGQTLDEFMECRSAIRPIETEGAQ